MMINSEKLVGLLPSVFIVRAQLKSLLDIAAANLSFTIKSRGPILHRLATVLQTSLQSTGRSFR